MRYTATDGTTERTGAVWAPGPLANSVWLLDDETGAPVVVKVPRGDVAAAVESAWTVALGAEVIAHQDDTTFRPSAWLGRWDRGDLGGDPPWTRDDLRPGTYFRSAPALREKVWRAAVGDQCAPEPSTFDQLVLPEVG